MYFLSLSLWCGEKINPLEMIKPVRSMVYVDVKPLSAEPLTFLCVLFTVILVKIIHQIVILLQSD